MSKPKPNNLAAALNKQARGFDPSAPTPASRSETPARSKETTREGKVMISGWLPMEARSSFRLIQAKYPEKRLQDLIAEAMNDLFAKYNVPQTAKDN
jgi:hypothetical protein